METLITCICIIAIIILFAFNAFKRRRNQKMPPNTHIPNVNTHVQTVNSYIRAHNSVVPQYIKIEAKRRLQVLNESLSIIDKTKNIDTLNSRYAEVCEHIKWIYDNGVSLSHKTKEEAQKTVSDNKNENIVRIANHVYSTYSTKILSLKTQKAKDNASTKMKQLLSECFSSIVPSPNDDISKKGISEIISKESSPVIVYSSRNINTSGIRAMKTTILKEKCSFQETNISNLLDYKKSRSISSSDINE